MSPSKYRHRSYDRLHERRRTYREHATTKPIPQARALAGKAPTSAKAKGAIIVTPPTGVMPTTANTGPESLSGSVSAAQFIADGGASHKTIIGQVSDQGGNAFLGRTFNADHCYFPDGIYYYAYNFPTNIPTFNLSYCEINSNFFFFSPVKGVLDHCYSDNGGYWVSDVNEAGRDHSDDQINVSWQGIQINNTMFHNYTGAPTPGFHVEALHIVGANNDMVFNNTRWAQDGPANINVTGCMKATVINTQFTNCWWDWNGLAAAANFAIYLEGRSISITGHAQTGYGAGGVSGTGYVYDYIWSWPFDVQFSGTPIGNQQYVIPDMSGVKDWFTNVSIGRGW